MSKESIKEKAKDMVAAVTTKTRMKKVQIPDRIEEVSLKWLRDAPFFSEFLLRFNYYITTDVPTMGVNSIRGRINLYINEQFMNGGGQRVKIDEKSGEPVLIRGDNGDPILDGEGNVQYEMEDWTGLTDQELEAVLIHEVFHLIRLHHERVGEKDAYIWNIAADMLINNDIKDMRIGNRIMKLPDGGVYLEMAQKDGYEGEEITEPLYDWLIEKRQEYMNQMQDLMEQQGAGQGQGQCPMCGGSGKVPGDEEGSRSSDGDQNGEGGDQQSNSGGAGDQQEDSGESSGGGSDGHDHSGDKPCPMCGGSGKGGSGSDLFDAVYGSKIDDHSTLEDSDELAESTIKEVIDVAKVRGWGNVSGNTVAKLEELIKPSKINWKQHLRNALASHIFSHGQIYENSWSRRNRRQLPLPGIKKLSNRAVIGVDTSGSISQAELEQFFTEIEKIVKDGSMLTIVQWDTSVKSVWNEYQKGDWRKIQIKGRGGTDVQNMFDWMIDNKKSKDLLIMFTDGWFSFDYDTHNVKTLWCVTNEEQDPPGGKKIYVEVQDDVR